MYKLKKKYIGKTLKNRGVSITLSDELPQKHLEYVFKNQKWGKEFVTLVKEKTKSDDKDNKIASE